MREQCLYLLGLGWEPHPAGRSQESHPGVNCLHKKDSCGQELGLCTILLTQLSTLHRNVLHPEKINPVSWLESGFFID